MKNLLDRIQPLGRALMLPIAVLPVAGLLLRLGQPDLLDVQWLSAAGQGLFSSLGLLFAVGVATGFARDGNGAACLAAVVGFLVMRNASEALIAVPSSALAAYPPAAAALAKHAYLDGALGKIDVPVGILAGVIGGTFYNRFATVKLPDYLGFFAGRRFVPILAGLAALGCALIIGAVYSWIDSGIDSLSYGITRLGPLGLFLYGVLNRLLLITGLHHILNNVVWFVVGHYGQVSGDLPRFFAGDPSAGGFMSGFYPVMMFGLPAACLAMYHAAPAQRRKEVSGMFGSLALTSLLTGVTEPIEFSFMFAAPLLFAIHALLTGISMALMSVLDIHLGFGFSAGLIDFVINFGRARHPLWVVPIGLLYGGVYYGIFRYAIERFDLQTPGREPVTQTPTDALIASDLGAAFLNALGGGDNLTEIDACTTRLRLKVISQNAIDEAQLKSLGAKGVIRPSPTTLQVVLGPAAEGIAADMRQAASAAIAAPPPLSKRGAPAAEAVTALSPSSALMDALGGEGNLIDLREFHGRLRARVRSTDAVDLRLLNSLALRQAVIGDAGHVHILCTNADRSSLVRG